MLRLTYYLQRYLILKITIDYTRYADDINTILSDSVNYDYIINALIKIIESEGFTPNYRKTKVIKQSQSQLSY